MDRGQDSLMKVESTAPGKIFLSGEYLVLDGAVATVMSTKQRVKVTIEDQTDVDNIFYCSVIDEYFPFNVNNNYQINWLNKNPGAFGLFLDLTIKSMQIKPKKTLFSIDTNDLYFNGIKIGLGSSAAISVAIVNALNDFYDLRLSKSEMINKSIELHKIHQGKTGSGLDVLSSYLSSDLLSCDIDMLRHEAWNTFNWPSHLFIKGVITSHQSSTSSMIEKYHNAKQISNSNFKNLYLQITKALKELSNAWLIGNSSIILELLKKHSLLMKQLDRDFNLGIYSEEHQKILKHATEFNLFYKPSGAGGGDLGFVLSDDIYKIQKFDQILSDINYQTIELR